MSGGNHSQYEAPLPPETPSEDRDCIRVVPELKERAGLDTGDLSSWCGMVLIALCVSVLLCWFWEWERSAAFLGMAPSSLCTLDGVALFCFICGKTFILLTPTIVLAGILIWCRFLRTASALMYLNLLLVMIFSVADAFTLSTYGCHIIDMVDVVKGGVNDIYRFVGDMSWWSGATGVAAIAGVCMVGLAFGKTTRAATSLLERVTAQPRRGAMVAVVVAMIAFIDSAVPLTLALSKDRLQPRLFLLSPAASFLPDWLPSKKLADDSNPDVHRARTIASGLVNESRNPLPVDSNAYVSLPKQPNILFIISECFRASDFNAGVMPKLQAMAKKGVVLENHFSGGNMTHFGLFSILYGRSCVVSNSVRRCNMTPQLCDSLHSSGYHISFLISDGVFANHNLVPLMNSKFFDHVVGGEPVGFEESDRRLAVQASQMLSKPRDQAQCVFVFFASPSPPYYYPASFEVFKPTASSDMIRHGFLRLPVEELRNRYKNSLLYVEELIVGMVDKLDLNRTIVVVTGDHGESLGEDGFWWHGGAMAESQFRVPFFILGKGIEARRVSETTAHCDIIPTLLHAISGSSIPVQGCHGIDVMNGVPSDRRIDVTPWHFPGMNTVIVSGPRSRVLLKIGKPDGELHEPEPVALLDAGGRIVLDSSR